MTEATFTLDELGRLRALVDSLGDTLDPSILIGGWATWMRIGGDAFFSHDIDLIINSVSLRSTLRDTLQDYSESHHRGGMKARGTIDGIHVDAYIPYESELGDRLRLKVDVLAQHVDEIPMRKWLLLNIEAHTISKMAALLDRFDKEKGAKDAREVMALLFPDEQRKLAPPDAAYAVRILFDATAGPAADVPAHVARVFELLPQVATMNKKRRRELDVLAKAWVNEAKDQLAARQRPQAGPTFITQPRRASLATPGSSRRANDPTATSPSSRTGLDGR